MCVALSENFSFFCFKGLILMCIMTERKLATLAAEIDRCLKKVAEGLEEFDMIWDKVCVWSVKLWS